MAHLELHRFQPNHLGILGRVEEVNGAIGDTCSCHDNPALLL